MKENSARNFVGQTNARNSEAETPSKKLCTFSRLDRYLAKGC